MAVALLPIRYFLSFYFIVSNVQKSIAYCSISDRALSHLLPNMVRKELTSLQAQSGHNLAGQFVVQKLCGFCSPSTAFQPPNVSL